ncbi:MAG TPA: response regulator [Rhodocyclaceae bacterium]|nr:response regulator [Rhodocyclaceae bacterium]
MGIFDKLRSILGHGESEEPVIGDMAPPAEPVERRSRERLNARAGTRVLIVDDSRTIVAALTNILRSASYVTLEASNAETGLELARSEQPELIFLDIVLPGMNGFSALRIIRKDPALRDIPVIMISGNEQATEQFFGARIGADDFMKKPFSRLEVFARIERLLDADLIPRRASAVE